MERLEITPTEYHKRDEISSGFVRCFATDGPWVAYHRFVTRSVPDSDSDEKRLGRIFHLAMEDSAVIDDKVLLMPEEVPNDWGKASDLEKKRMEGDSMPYEAKYKRHREFRDSFIHQAEEEGKEVMLPGDKDALTGMVESVWENPECRQYLGTPRETHEVACVSEDLKTGLPIKALADILLDDIVVDFKSTRQSTALTFVRDARKKGYHWQADHYLRTTGRQKHVIISVRNVEPWESMVYTIKGHMMAAAREDNDRELWSIKNCFDTNSWHSLGWGTEQELDYEGVVM